MISCTLEELQAKYNTDEYHLFFIDGDSGTHGCAYRIEDIWTGLSKPQDIPLKDIPRVEDIIQMMKNENDMERVNQADLSFPIVLSDYVGIVDGCHRIYKAHLNGQKTIKACYIKKLPVPIAYCGSWELVNEICSQEDRE